MTNKQINKLGDRIAYAKSVDLVTREDLDMLQEYRKTYKDPLAKTFNRLLTLARKVDKGTIAEEMREIKKLSDELKDLKKRGRRRNQNIIIMVAQKNYLTQIGIPIK